MIESDLQVPSRLKLAAVFRQSGVAFKAFDPYVRAA
jgi:hypothetical protein